MVTTQQALELALQHHQAGRLEEAETLYRQFLAQEPNHPDALHLLGMIANQKGEYQIAVQLLGRAVAIMPMVAAYRGNLGQALAGLGRTGEAISAYRLALKIQPDYPEAQNNLGNALVIQGEVEAAIATFRAAVHNHPDCAEIHYNLATALCVQGAFDAGIASYQNALRIQPNHIRALTNLGNAYKEVGQLDETISAYRQAIALKPNDAAAHSNFIFTLNYHPDFDAGAIAEEQDRWNRRHAEPLRQFLQPHPNDHIPDRRLRIGYVSPDFRNHCQSLFTVPLFSHHDHRHFEIFCYADVSRPDGVTDRIRGFADIWRSTVGLSERQIAERIRNDRIDILVDLTMHMDRNRLLVFALKPAPVQVTWLGYPGSTGLSTIDYRLSDPYLDPPSIDSSVYAERTLRLPHSFWCYDPLDGGDIPVTPLPAVANNFITFSCLNNFCKVNDSVVRLWAKVLQVVTDSRLLLLAPEGRHRLHILELLRQEGIGPERMEFALPQPRGKYLELYQRIDLCLDTFPYNGHTTSLDSFWMGVPVITLVGQTIVGRAGLCQLMNLNLPELIASTPEQYVQIAAELANDLPRLIFLRSTLRQRMQAGPLMDAARFARNVEHAYRTMWQRWCSEK